MTGSLGGKGSRVTHLILLEEPLFQMQFELLHLCLTSLDLLGHNNFKTVHQLSLIKDTARN